MIRQAKAQRMLTHEQIWGALDRLAARAGLSPSGLAKRAGLDPTTFNKSKRVTSDGRERWPSTESLAKALAAAGSSIETFVRLIGDGDITAAVAPSLPESGVDLYYGVGGSPEGVLTATALKALGGGMLLRCWPRDDAEHARLRGAHLE